MQKVLTILLRLCNLLGMTIPDWLETTKLTNAEIAEHCGVDASQPTRWRNGNIPQGVALLKLVALSKGKITSDDIPVQKRGPKAKRPRARLKTA